MRCGYAERQEASKPDLLAIGQVQDRRISGGDSDGALGGTVAEGGCYGCGMIGRICIDRCLECETGLVRSGVNRGGNFQAGAV
jgi:hypothetical protein